MRFKKLTYIITTMISASLLFSACGSGGSGSGGNSSSGNASSSTSSESSTSISSSGSSSSSSTSTSSGDTIKIGLNYELSGQVASYGQSSVDGITLAIEEANAEGGVDGKKIEIVKGDNKSDPGEATSIATKLITQDKIVAVLGPATSGNVSATIPVETKNKVPLLTGSATADNVTNEKGKVNEYIFRICYSDSFQGVAMANYAKSTLSANNAVVLIDNASDYSLGLADSFKEKFEALGGKVVEEEAYVTGEKDYKAVLTKIKDKDFDVIFLPGYYEDVALLIKQARELGIDKPFLGCDGYDSPDLQKIAGEEALNKVYYSNHYSPEDNSDNVTKFKANFKAKYGKDPNAFNALGYDEGLLIVDAIKRAGSADSEKIKDALASTKDFEGVTGKLSIDENHNAIKAITVVELVNGEAKFNQKIEP